MARLTGDPWFATWVAAQRSGPVWEISLDISICTLALADTTGAGGARHCEPLLKVQVDIFRPAGLTAARSVMRNLQRACGCPDSVLIETFSRFFFLQGSFLFLPVIAHMPISTEYRVLCIHGCPSLGGRALRQN
jgi:hypothetical protein